MLTKKYTFNFTLTNCYGINRYQLPPDNSQLTRMLNFIDKFATKTALSMAIDTKTLIPLLILLVSACNFNKEHDSQNEGNDNIIIGGTLENGADQMVTLDRMGTAAFVPVESVRCDTDGQFSFTFTGEGTDFYALRYTEHGYVTIIARPGDSVTITGNTENLYPYRISGSEDSELVRSLAEAHRATLDQLRTIGERTAKLTGNEDFVLKKQALNREFDSITAAFTNYSRDFILNHPGSPAILIALYNQFGPELPVFDPVEDFDIYQFVDSSLYQKFPENEAVRALHSELSAALQQIRNRQPEKKLEVGEKAPDFVMTGADNAMVTLSEFRGNHVLLHFWASWSKPSMEQNSSLLQCHEQYMNKKFIILQVSVDHDRQQWISAIDTSRTKWYHVSDLQRWESPVIDLYRVDRIPANFLIDPGGTIIEKDIFDGDLLSALNKYIN
jgi:peroxiredoxin